jgi:hypothetical protein
LKHLTKLCDFSGEVPFVKAAAIFMKLKQRRICKGRRIWHTLVKRVPSTKSASPGVNQPY